MADSSPPRGPARETRLLLLTLLVSVAVLFLLARFRFPERPLTDLSPPQPLARLARGTAFDELSGSLTELLRRFEASVVVLRVVSTTPGGAGGPGTIRLVPALRVRDDLALAPLSRDDRPIGVGDGQGSAAGAGASGGSASSGASTGVNASGGSGSAGGGNTSGGGILPANAVVARDELRGLAMVRVPARQAPPLLATPANEPNDLPGYVAVLEASPSGAIIRAEFVSSLSRASRRGWDTPAILVGGVTHAQPGALLFSLTGRFIGMALPDAAPGAVIVAPGDAVLAQVERLARGESLRLARPGFEVQPLTAALARATGTAAGVMVSAIATPGPAGPPLNLGDVITTADGQPIRSTGDWQQALQRAAARGSARPSSAADSAQSGAASTTPAASAAAAASARGAGGATGPGSASSPASASGSGSGSGSQPSAPAKPTAPPAAAPGAATGAAGGPVTMRLEVVRFGQTLQVTLPLAMSEAPDDVDGALRGAAAAGAAGSAAATAPGSSLGATFRPAAGGTLDIVSVTPAGPAARAGLRPGDRVTALLPARGPLTAARLAAAFGALKSRDALVLAVNRPDGAAIVSVDRP